MDERLIETIDGYAKLSEMCGYCKAHQGCLTRRQRKLHRCKERNCMHYINFYFKECEQKKPYGESYRQSLKRKKKRKK